eukprot:scpid91516/ scgid5322/ Ras-related protein Rab-28
MSDSDDASAPKPGSKDACLKVVLVGDGTAGKTSLVNRFKEDEFGRDYNQTLGVDFAYKTVVLGDRDRREINLKLWDIGGQTIGGRMLPNYLSGVDAVLFVYDVTNAESFSNIEEWIAAVSSILEDQREQGTLKKDPHLSLVANKVDDIGNRVVKRVDHAQAIKTHNMSGHFVSARSGENVEQMFKLIAARVVGYNFNKKELEELSRVSLHAALRVEHGYKHGYKHDNNRHSQYRGVTGVSQGSGEWYHRGPVRECPAGEHIRFFSQQGPFWRSTHRRSGLSAGQTILDEKWYDHGRTVC